ncbi:MAG TPA: MFS transporter [Desulfobacterales bacterium]|nr:MFS transporter [Desulfobacterales bacterium]
MAYIHELELNKLLDHSEMTPFRWYIWILAALGLYIDGFDFFVIGVAMPLLDAQWDLSAVLKGALGVSALVGAVFGAMISGYLSDRLGRKLFFTIDIIILIISAILCAVAWDVYSLIAFRFTLGVGVGAEYPISAAFISEAVPMHIRGRMLIAGFSFQALGMLTAALVGLLVLVIFPDHIWDWRLILGAVVIPATIILILRSFMPQSIRWLLAKGKSAEAVKILRRYIPDKREEIDAVLAIPNKEIQTEMKEKLGFVVLFSRKYIRRTILASVPWFFMDIATYGIGIFAPMILAQIAFSAGGDHSLFAAELKALEEAAFIDTFLVIGFAVNFYLIEKLGRIKLQTTGFLGMTVGLFLLGLADLLSGGAGAHLVLVFSGFIVFNILMNAGPNSTTFMLPVELYPTKIRATGHGFAAATGKLGAVVGVFFLPIVKNAWGTAAVMFIVAGMTFLGFLITVLFRVETRGKTLDEIQS